VNAPEAGPARLSVLVTGSSTGLGLETALHLAARGFDVYATVRNPDHRSDVLAAAEARKVVLHVDRLDVTDPYSIEAAIERVMSRSGALYGLVNNAGIALRGCVEDLEEDEVRAVFEANVMGTFAVTRRVLPHMRAAGRGRVVTISSVGGRIATFGLAAYCASKFAQEAFGEALALEIAPLGLASILVEPGIIKTSRWGVNRGNARHALDPASAYHAHFRRHEAIADELVERSRTTPADVARAVHEALTARRPRLRYVVGRPANAAILLRRYLPNGIFERLYFGHLLKQLTGASVAVPPVIVSGHAYESGQERGG
jgi:NAD(P)-dependent dehydrogenase (short-subunit alcohol dehydrogenase family)